MRLEKLTKKPVQGPIGMKRSMTLPAQSSKQSMGCLVKSLGPRRKSATL